MRLIARLLTFFYRHLYHDFAFAYDAVAGVVSFGQWIEWTRTTLPYVQGARILEIGHGPGHLQHNLNESAGTPQAGSSLFVAGLDESAQMGRITRRRLVRENIDSPRLVRSLAQAIPFQADSFDTVVSTFPSVYIFQMETLAEVHRVLRTGGRFIVLPAAWPKSPPLRWLYRLTGESPADSLDIMQEKWSRLYASAGFTCRTEIVDLRSSIILLIIATK